LLLGFYVTLRPEITIIGNAVVQSGPDLGSRVAAVPMTGDECLFEGALTKAMRDRIVSDLRQILGRLDTLELWLAGAHLSSAIDYIQKEGVVDQAPPGV
jgi:hypothetical protein